MKKYYWIFLIAVSTSLQAQQQASATSYSLEDCIRFALENNQQVKNTQLDVTMSRHRVGEILADGLPQISASADLGYNFKVPTSFIPAEFFGGEPGTFAPVQFQPAYNGTASVGLDQMIFDGSYFVGLKASRTYTELSRKDKIRTEIEAVAQVSKAYYLALINRERFELIEKNYARLDSLYRQTLIMFENGFAEKIDVSRVKVQLNNAAVEKNNFANTLDISYALLKFQMGMDVSRPIELKDKIEEIQFEELNASFGENFSYDDRIEMSILKTNYDLVNLDIKNTQVRYLPKLDLYSRIGAGTGAGNSSDFFNFGDNWFGFGIVGLRLNVPVFDGLRKSRQIQQKRLQAEQIENSQEGLQKSIDLEIKTAQATLKRSVDNLLAQRENMELAEGVYNVTKIKYNEGVGSNIDVVEADAAFKQAQTNYYNALYDALVAKIDIEKAYGKLWNSNSN